MLLCFTIKIRLKIKQHIKDNFGDMERRNSSLMSEEDSEKLQLFFSCRNLADLDFITVTDSFLIIKLQEPYKPQKTLLKTKVYDNTLNPDYAQTVTLDYFFEIRQQLILEVYHQASPPKLVGKAETTVGQIFGSQNNGLKKPLLNSKGKNCGEIIVRCEVVGNVVNNVLEMNVSAYDLPSSCSFLCFGGSNNPFFRIFRVRERDQLLIYQSQIVFDTENPRFKRVSLSERRLCKNNPDKDFEIRFYKYSGTGAHTEIGTIVTSVNRILDPKAFPILNRSNSEQGTVQFAQIKRFTKYRFMDFMSSGLQLLLITCIDFTASNGSPNSPQSLHYIQANKKSQYEEALEEVSKILLDYDSDKLVPVYGFGAKVNMPTFQSFNKVHHCFPLNGNQENAHVFMMEGIMQAYRQSLQYLQFGGPTLFSALLGQAIEECRELRKQVNQYMIVFILTDGQIHDKTQVIDQIIECCNLPISLIIVGVGNGPFDIMHQLDDDDCQLIDSKGRRTYRDLVQFVEFRNFKNNGIELAREVLEQLPRQVEQYYQIIGITPTQFPRIAPMQMSVGNAAQQFMQNSKNQVPPFGYNPNINRY